MFGHPPWAAPKPAKDPEPTHWHVVVYYPFGKPRTIKVRKRDDAELEARIEAVGDPLRTVEIEGCAGRCIK